SEASSVGRSSSRRSSAGPGSGCSRCRRSSIATSRSSRARCSWWRSRTSSRTSSSTCPPPGSTRGSAMRDPLRRLLRSPFGATGLALFGALLLTALFAPLIATQDPIALVPRDALQGPSPAHLFGTDDLGRDVFSRVIWGSRLAVRLGVLSVVIAASGGVVLGLLAGYYGGWVDNLISRLLEVVLAFPGILFAIAIVAILGPSLDNLIIALGLFGWPGYARLVRASVLSAKQREYVEAARATGATESRIMARHLLPNVIAPVIILSATRFGCALLAGSGLSFIGLGVPSAHHEWCAIIATGRVLLLRCWWVF